MDSVTHRKIETNGIQMHIAEAGDGPLVLMLHGFPEGWYSWRHQLLALAEAGYHAVAPDERGYGQTDRPAEIRRYSMLHLVGDVVGLIDALGEKGAVVAGHDWGANVAWNTALLRPDLIRGVAGLAVPHRPRNSRPPLEIGRSGLGTRYFQLYYQEPGIAEREFEADVRRTMQAFLCGESGQATRVFDLRVADSGMLDALELVDPLPSWLTETDLDHWTTEFSRTGFAGALNWYRNQTTNWELLAPWSGASILAPALYMVGDRDPVQYSPRHQNWADGLKRFVPHMVETIVLEGCGHWIQQEQPGAVNRALLAFLGQVYA